MSLQKGNGDTVSREIRTCNNCVQFVSPLLRMSSLPNGALLPLSKISLPPLLFLRDDVDYDSLPSSSPFSLSFSPTQVLGSFDHYLHLASPPSLSFARQWTVRFSPCLAFFPSFRLREEGVQFFLNGLHPFPLPLPVAALIAKPKLRPLPPPALCKDQWVEESDNRAARISLSIRRQGQYRNDVT